MTKKRVRDRTPCQLRRFHDRLWKRLTWGDGYQPFGYDWPTMYVNFPFYGRVLRRVRQLHDQKVMSKP